MKNILLKASHIKQFEICTESENQYISVLSVRIHGQTNHRIVDKHPTV